MRTRPTVLPASVWALMLANQGSSGSQGDEPVVRKAWKSGSCRSDA